MPDPNHPSFRLTIKNGIAYEENQVVNSEEGAPGAGYHHLQRGGNGRRPGLCILKWREGIYAEE